MSADNVLGWQIVLKISHLPSKLRFSTKCSFFRRSLSRGHYQPTYQPPEGVYLLIITYPLIFDWFNWLFYVTWHKSLDIHHAITPARFDICPPLVSVEEKHSQHKNFNFSFLLFNMKGNQTIVTESSDGYIKKLIASAVPESTKKSPKCAVLMSLKVEKVTSRLLIFSPT